MKRSYCSYEGTEDNCADGCDGCYYKVEEEIVDDVNECTTCDLYEYCLRGIDCKCLDIMEQVDCGKCQHRDYCIPDECPRYNTHVEEEE